MSKQEQITIKDICCFIPGSQPPKSKFIHYPKEGYIRLIQIRDRLNDNFITYIPVDSSTKLVDSNEILIGRYGPPIFQVFRGFCGAYNVALMKAVPCDGVDNDYLYYFLLQQDLLHYVESMSLRTAGQTGVQLDSLYKYPVVKRSLIEQKEIAKALKVIDDKILNNSSICSTLESMAKLLYDYWFVQHDFPDENGKPYKSSGGKMVWNEALKREIPEGWEVRRIGDMISTERGISYGTPNIETGTGVPMLNLATFMPGGGDYKADGLKHFLGDYPKNKVIHPYELIMCNTQQTAIKFETDIIGRAMLVPDIFDGDVVFSHHVNVIRTADMDMKYYLLFLFNSDYFHKYISGFTNGTNILGLSFNGVEDYLTEIPSNALLEKFGEMVLTVEKKKSEIIKENEQLASLRDFLLPMLMNGQVRVGDSKNN